MMDRNSSEVLLQQIRSCTILIHRLIHSEHSSVKRGPMEGGIGRGQGLVLRVLAENDGLAQSELAEELDIRPSSLGELVMGSDAPCPITTLRVDGGASVSDILMQTQADLLRLEVDRPAQVETTAFGAAALAGLCAGVWRDLAELSALRRSQHVFLPLRDAADCAADYAQWQRAVSRARGWMEHEYSIFTYE